MAGKLAELFVAITGNAGPLNATLSAVRGSLGGLVGLGTAAGAGIGRGLGLGVAALGSAGVAGAAALGIGLYKAVRIAGDLGETLDKVDDVFGPAKAGVISYADTMADKFGLVKGEVLDAVAMFGLISQGMGKTKQESATLGVELAGLAADVSSLYNLPLDTALEKIRAGLTGEAEPLKALGVIMTEDAVKARALAMGFKAVGGELSNQGKLAARTAIITEGLQAAQGNLAKTSGSFANQTRKLGGGLQNLMGEVGNAISPISGAIVGGLGSALGGLVSMFEANKQAIAGWASWAVAGFRELVAAGGEVYGSFREFLGGESGQIITGGVGAALQGLGATFRFVRDSIMDGLDLMAFGLRNWGDIAQAVGIQVGGYWTNFVELLGWARDATGTYLEWFARNFRAIYHDAFDGSLAIAENSLSNLRGLASATWDYITSLGKSGFNPDFKPMLEGFRSTVEAMPAIAGPALSSVQGQIDEVFARTADREAQRADKKARDAAAIAAGQVPDSDSAPAKKGDAAKAAAPGKEKAAAHDDFLGFSKKLAEGALGKGDKAAEGLAVQKEQLAVQREQLAATKGQRSATPPPAVAMGPS